MTWYEIGCLVCVIIFALQVICQLIGFDLDFEIDDEFSFKGLLHFLCGFFVTLCCFDTITVVSVAVALIIGLLLTFGLGVLYKIMYTKLQEEINYQQEIPKQLVEIYTWNKTSGEVTIILEGVAKQIYATSDKERNLKYGDRVYVEGNRQLVKIID